MSKVDWLGPTRASLPVTLNEVRPARLSTVSVTPLRAGLAILVGDLRLALDAEVLLGSLELHDVAAAGLDGGRRIEAFHALNRRPDFARTHRIDDKRRQAEPEDCDDESEALTPHLTIVPAGPNTRPRRILESDASDIRPSQR